MSKDLVSRLRYPTPALASHALQAADLIVELEQQLAANDADAKRYRWLRDELRNDSLVMNDCGYILVGDELNAAIDKELGKK